MDNNQLTNPTIPLDPVNLLRWEDEEYTDSQLNRFFAELTNLYETSLFQLYYNDLLVEIAQLSFSVIEADLDTGEVDVLRGELRASKRHLKFFSYMKEFVEERINEKTTK